MSFNVKAYSIGYRFSGRAFGRTAAALGAALALGLSAGAWAAACAPELKPYEVSMEVHKLKTSLMVAALSCGKRSNYNAFVRKFQPSLKKHGAVMKAHFNKQYGARANKQLNKFVTALANKASQRSNADFGAFCDDAGKVFEVLEEQGPAELGGFITSGVMFDVSFKPEGDECGKKPNTLFPDLRKDDPLQ